LIENEKSTAIRVRPPEAGHHSLVTPIDWKQSSSAVGLHVNIGGHHSLVTPID
jgi:hypothetical protein